MTSADFPLPRISVLMSVYNDAATLPGAIDSILSQSEERFEFLIVNDGSSDGSTEILRDFAARDSRILLFEQENKGLIASINGLIDHARAPIIARMDGDDISLPDRFAIQLAYLDQHPEIALVGAHTIDMDERGILSDSVRTYPHGHDEIVSALRMRNVICQPVAMIRTEVLRALGGYRAMFKHCEDYDLWLRLAERYRCANLPETLLHYRRSAGQVSQQYRLEQATGAVFAQMAHDERMAGRPDPFEGRSEYPDIASLDAVFDRGGMAMAARARIIAEIQYSRQALADGGYAMMRAHLRDGGIGQGYWRTIARMVRFGMPRQALSLALWMMIA